MMSALLSEDLIDSLGILIANLGESRSFFEFDLFIMNHIEKIFSLLIADASILAFVFVVTKYSFKGLWLKMSLWGV